MRKKTTIIICIILLAGNAYAAQQFIQSDQTTVRRRFKLFLVDATDGITAETGEGAGQPQISVNGGTFADTTNTLVHVGSGKYYVTLTASELATEGDIMVRYKSANTAEYTDIGIIRAQTATEKLLDNIRQLLFQLQRTVDWIEFLTEQEDIREKTPPEISQ